MIHLHSSMNEKGRSEETGKPILNVSSHIKKKPNQKTAATCKKSQVRPNRMMPKK